MALEGLDRPPVHGALRARPLNTPPPRAAVCSPAIPRRVAAGPCFLQTAAVNTAAAAPPVVRPARAEDTPRFAAIYAHHVRTGVATFETEVPDDAEMARRHRDLTAHGFPWLAAERGREVIGFAYAGPFRPRAAYAHTVEDSIYLDPRATGAGAGTALLDALVAAATAAGFRQMIAVIGDSANVASIALHAKCGFIPAGTLRSVGFKLGRWVDTVHMQRALGAGDASPPVGQDA
jgi:phosphinothricin acetyltransferase